MTIAFTSIRGKLIGILAVLGLLPLLVMGYLSYESATEALQAQAQEQLGNLAEKTAQQVDGFIQGARKDIDLLAGFPFIQLAFLQHEFSQRLDTVQGWLLDYGDRNPYLNHIYLIDLAGRPILTVPAEPKTGETRNFRDTPWFTAALENRPYLDDMDAGTIGVRMGRLVFDFEDASKPVGVLAFDIKKGAFIDYIASLRIGQTGYAFLMDRDGRLIYHPVTRTAPQASSETAMNPDDLEKGDDRLRTHLQRMMAGDKGHGQYHIDGEERFLVYTRCGQKPWRVGITVSQAEMMADIDRLRKRLVTIFLVVVAMILPVSLLFIKSITRPIRQLITGVNAIGNGDLDQTIQVESSDELRAVAMEFNKMAARLKANMGDILDLKKFHEDILRNVTSGIITVDHQANVTSINKSAKKILGSLSPSPMGTSDSESHPSHTPGALSPIPVDLQPIFEQLKETLSGGAKIEHRELTVQRSGRDPQVLEVNTSLLASQVGKVFGAISEIRDITQRKRIEEGLLRVEKLASLGELSAGMAHEIRNPLAGMKTSVQVLAQKVRNPSEEILLEGILHEIDRLDKIVSDLLRFSRPGAPVPTPTDLIDILEKTMRLVSEKIRKHGITVVRGYAAHPSQDMPQVMPQVMVDRGQIRQVFLNLLLNSIKAMGPGGRLTLEVRKGLGHPEGLQTPSIGAAGFVEVLFSDTGRGIPEAHLSKIFNPFFTTDPQGTGLGLSIVHKLLEENHGYVFVDSVADQGTRVTVGLPIRVAA